MTTQRTTMVKRIGAGLCALSLLAGAVVYNSNRSDVAKSIENKFSVQAYAAGEAKATKMKDNKIVFDSGSGNASDEYGLMSGSLFKVTGENIDKVQVKLDKEALYRQNTYTGRNDAESLLEKGTTDGKDIVTGYDEAKKELYANTAIGNDVTESYDKDAMYGFMLTKDTYKSIEKSQKDKFDTKQLWHDSMDVFDGAKLTIKVTYKDGTEETKTITLHTGKVSASDSSVMVDDKDEKTPYVYAIYGEIK